MNNSDSDQTNHDDLELSLEDFRVLAQTGRELAREVAIDRLLQNILKTASHLTDSPDFRTIC